MSSDHKATMDFPKRASARNNHKHTTAHMTPWGISAWPSSWPTTDHAFSEAILKHISTVHPEVQKQGAPKGSLLFHQQLKKQGMRFPRCKSRERQQAPKFSLKNTKNLDA